MNRITEDVYDFKFRKVASAVKRMSAVISKLQTMEFDYSDDLLLTENVVSKRYSSKRMKHLGLKIKRLVKLLNVDDTNRCQYDKKELLNFLI